MTSNGECVELIDAREIDCRTVDADLPRLCAIHHSTDCTRSLDRIMPYQSPISPGISWYEDTAGDRPEYPALDGDRRADVVIVGGGFTGLSAAAHLAKAGADVALIEAHRFGDGASGRNGGQLGTGQRAWARRARGRARLDARQGAVRPCRGGQGASARIRRGQRHRHRLHARPAVGRAQAALCRRLPQICRLHARARRLSAHLLHGRRPRRPSGSARRTISAARATPAPAISIR